MSPPPPSDDRDVGGLVRRAQELADASDGPEAEAGLDGAMVAEVAKELGVPTAAVAQALAEAEAGLSSKSGVLDRLVGPNELAALRRSSLTADEARVRAQRWLDDVHGLRTRVDANGVVLARPRTDFVGVVRRGIKRASGLGGLGRVRQVRVAVADVSDDVAICVVADVGGDRRRSVIAGAASGTATGAAGGALGIVVLGAAAPVALAAVPVAALVGVGVARWGYRGRLEQVDDALQATADGLSRGERPPTVVGKLTDRLAERTSGSRGQASAPRPPSQSVTPDQQWLRSAPPPAAPPSPRRGRRAQGR